MKEKVSIEVVKKAQAGDSSSVIYILKSCNFLIFSELKKYSYPSDMIRDEFLLAGKDALVDAILGFDASRNASFETFATMCIHNKFVDKFKEIKDNNTISMDNTKNNEVAELIHGVPDNKPTPEDIAIEQETKEAIFMAMKKYFTDEELRIIACWDNNDKYEEIIKKLNVTQSKIANTITKLNHYAKKIREDAGL